MGYVMLKTNVLWNRQKSVKNTIQRNNTRWKYKKLKRVFKSNHDIYKGYWSTNAEKELNKRYIEHDQI